MTNRRIEYVFGPPRPSTGHSLGISTMELSTDISLLPNSYGTMFTGGRDGRINAWGLSPVLTPQHGTQAARASDIHTNWVSDLQVLSNDSVASCSADTTVKLWNVKSNNITTIGHHTDYAQCLSKLSNDTVVSGGLDEKIMGWNLNRPGGQPEFEIKAGHGIYAISTAPPHLVVCGSADGAVRIWDTREEHYIAKFAGHTDSVRSLFVANGDTVVSGSSDSTVRVWSLRTGRVFKTFDQFHSSVWSLQPHGQGFLAGDRDGNIYESKRFDEEPQIVVEHAVREGGLKGLCVDPVTSNLWTGTPFSPDLRCINPQTGNEVEILKGHSGLRKHRLMNDKRRALIVDTSGEVGMVDLVSAKQLDFRRKIETSKGHNLDLQLDEILEEVNTMDVLDNWCQVQTKTGQVCVTLDHRSINNTEVYLDDLTKHVSEIEKTPFPTPKQSPQATPKTTPGASPMTTPVGSGFFRQGRSPMISPAVSRVTSAQSLAEVIGIEQQRQKNRLGTGQGHAKFFTSDEEDEDDEQQQQQRSVAQGGHREKTKKSSSMSSSRTAAAKVAAAAATGTKLNDEETEEPADNETADDEIRINLGNYVLENLLRGVISRLQHEYGDLPEPPFAGKSANDTASTNGSARGSRSGTPSSSVPSRQNSVRDGGSDGRERKRTKFLKMFGLGKKKDEDHDVSSATASPSAQQHGGNSAPGSGSPSNESPQQLKQKVQQQHQSEPDSTCFQEAWSRAVANRSLQSADPESPDPDVLSRRAKLVITDTAPGAGAPTEIFSTTVGRLIHEKSEVDKIEKVLPGWVGDAVLLGKLNLKQPTKIGFAVSPSEDSDLPELTPDSTRLMAISMLRARKIMAYTVGQLQQLKILSSEASNCLPEELITLKCQDTEVTPLTTLGTIRTRIWRKGGDVVMNYTLKKRV